MTRHFAIFLAFLSAGWAAPFTAIGDGERFTYRVSFAVFPRAGEIVIAAKHEFDPSGRGLVRVTTETSSRGVVRGLYAFDNRAEVIIDAATSRALLIKEQGEDPKRSTESETVFDYDRQIARHTDRQRPERSGELALPEGAPLDLITALVQTREWNLKPGEKREVLVIFGRDIYPLAIYADGFEEIQTPLGKFKTLVLVPRMENNPKGLFKRGGEIKVWIAQDGSRLPVKMQLKLKFGSAALLLAQHEFRVLPSDDSRH